MSGHIKQLFKGYLLQLETIVNKVPPELFSESLTDDMFSLEMNAKIAANFVLRGYYPLLGEEAVLLMSDEVGKAAVVSQIIATRELLETLPEIRCIDDSKVITDKAGFSEIEVCQSDFIHRYIVPNYFFHMGIVYAIAKSNGVAVSKGDFDGLHSYPADFSFVSS
ncbi:hypothetical protein SAMN02745753_00422 [Marinomonas polaris DSM 16579]|uniref:DUF1993 domain-containing protein n=1 Tax=Marinomonas polaris DSM 16579 TaxID=1122206 RepID=A0A1M4U001_9GAMM|nr:DUF1993 family protein [Marinomonas polaris]SHE50038.1 hypothetical protein SAMN02745753_00422 [Marinomonas polaris DSM 16579]